MDEKDLKKSKEILINLYQSLKIRKLDEVNNNFIINKNQLDEIDENSFEEEKKYLQKLSILTLTEYIDSAIGVIVNLKIEDELNKKNKERSEKYEDIGDWETLLRKEEEDIRMYISNELKLKLYIDQMEEKMETLEKEKKSLSLKLENMKSLESEVNNYKEKVKLLNTKSLIHFFTIFTNSILISKNITSNTTSSSISTSTFFKSRTTFIFITLKT